MEIVQPRFVYEGGLNEQQLQEAAKLMHNVLAAEVAAEPDVTEVAEQVRMLESTSIVMATRGIARAAVQKAKLTYANHKLNQAMKASKEHFLNHQGEYYTTALAYAESDGITINRLTDVTFTGTIN